MPRRYDTLRTALIAAVEHALAEGTSWNSKCDFVDDGPRIYAIQLGAPCVECGWSVVNRDALAKPHTDDDPIDPAGPHLRHASAFNVPVAVIDRDHEAIPDDEATGVIFHVRFPSDPPGETRRLAKDDEIWDVLGLKRLCDVLDRLTKPPDLEGLGRYLAFGKEEL